MRWSWTCSRIRRRVTEEEKNLIQKLGLNENIRTGLLTGKARFYTLTLDREIELPAGSAVCCPLRIGNGFAASHAPTLTACK
jgi:hypothetical protein